MKEKISEEKRQRVLQIFTGEAWLENLKSAEEIHVFAANFNWDNGYEWLNWIIDHPLCSRGTALMLYWLSEPVYYLKKDVLEISEYQLNGFKFVHKLQNKYLNNGFADYNIGFDPRNDDSTDWIKDSKLDGENSSVSIPSEMLKPVPGRDLSRDYW